MHLLIGNRNGRIANEWRAPRNHFVHHDAKRIQVAARVGLAALCLLGRKISGGAHYRARLGEAVFNGRTHGAGNAEVSNLHLAIEANQNVARLNVAVHHTVVMSYCKCCGHLNSYVARLIDRQFALVGQQAGKRSTLYKLHCNEIGVVYFAPVVHRNDVWVRKVGCRLRLASKPLDKRGVICKLGKQHLQCNGAIEQNVARQKHFGHASTANAALYPVTLINKWHFFVSHCHLQLPLIPQCNSLHP